MTYEAFVPAPIRAIEPMLSRAVAADVSDAEAALSRLQGHSSTSGLEALSRSLMRSEAVASSWIEALRVSHRKLAEAQQAAAGSGYEEARRVLCNVRAMDIGLGAHSEPFTVDDVLSMHGSLMSTSNVRADRDRAGAFRFRARLHRRDHTARRRVRRPAPRRDPPAHGGPRRVHQRPP